ncbi:MAG: hypothetical protein WCR24_07735 [Candidatus Methanomethylophilaceae archaeon]
MSQRINYLVYLFGSAFLALGIAYSIADMVIFGIHPSIEDMLSNLIVVLIGLPILAAGILLFRENMKSATIYSILLISCMMTGAFTYYMLFKSSAWKEFLFLTAASAVVVIVLYKVCAKTGINDTMNGLNPWYKGRLTVNGSNGHN